MLKLPANIKLFLVLFASVFLVAVKPDWIFGTTFLLAFMVLAYPVASRLTTRAMTPQQPPAQPVPQPAPVQQAASKHQAQPQAQPYIPPGAQRAMSKAALQQQMAMGGSRSNGKVKIR